MQTVYHAANPIDAQRIVALLAHEGIEAHVQGTYLAGAIGELPAGELVRVWVHDDVVERARSVLAEAEEHTAIPVEDDVDEPAATAAMAVSPQGSGLRVANGWVGLVFGLLIGFGLAWWHLRLPAWSEEVDYDHDGIADTTYTYQGELLTRTSEDRNSDSRPDVEAEVRSDGSGTARTDDDFDGRFEMTTTFRKNQPTLMEIDEDGDGFIEYRQRLVNGVTVDVVYLDPATQAVFKRETYDHGWLVRSELDANRDGIFESKRNHDTTGEIVP